MAVAVEDISTSELSWAQERPWKALLHYRPNILGKEKSTIDASDFFFAADGNENPKSEAIAFAKALQENKIVGKLPQTVFCAFPERTRFLLEKTRLVLPAEVRNQKCTLYEKYWAQFNDPDRISLVFSSAYPNNPASMFGHTLLKVHSKRQSDLLDIGLNYAAVVPVDENPFAFFWFGTTGGYEGRWSIQPYYVKVQDYVNFESRDLWEYEINLTTEEVKRLLNHIWEVEANSYSGYFFFDENCSYQILANIEAVRPDWNLLVYHIYVIPGESVKFLTRQNGAIRQVRYRPALYRKALASYASIPPGEKLKYNQLLLTKTQSELKELSTESLDTFLIEMDFKRNQDKKFANNWAEFEKALRLERSRRGVLGVKSSLSHEQGSLHHLTRPDLGHDAYNIQLGAGHKVFEKPNQGLKEERSFANFKIKSAYHDLLNSDVGYSQFSEIDFPWIQFSVDSKNKVRLDELGGLQTISLAPITHFQTPISFKAKAVLENYDFFEKQFYFLNTQAGLGLTTGLGFLDQRLYSLINFELQIASQFQSGYRLLPGIEFGYLWDYSNRYKLQLFSEFKCNVVRSPECHFESNLGVNQSFFLRQNHELRNSNFYHEINIEEKITELNLSVSYIYFFN